MQTILAFVIVLLLLVVIHELGHFFAAKFFGVRVEEFGVGYPPRARKLFTWRGTLFTLNWLPFGGFVKIFGEDEAADADPRSFAQQAFWKRAIILVAGVASNILLAIVLYSASFAIGFLGSAKDFPQSIQLAPEHVVVTGVLKNSPAQIAGLKGGDTILSLGSGTDTDTVTTPQNLITFIHAHGAAPLRVTVLRGDKMQTFTATPNATLSSGKPGIGIDITSAARMRLPLGAAIKTGFAYTFAEFKSIFVGLGQIVSGVFGRGPNILGEVAGPVGIAKIAGAAFTLGLGSFLSFMALISVNLAVVNLLPFPALDGGRLVLECFASKGRSRIPGKVVSWLNQIGFLILIVLMLYVTYHDIARIFS
jgi:regulator of sigma E protease